MWLHRAHPVESRAEATHNCMWPVNVDEWWGKIANWLLVLVAASGLTLGRRNCIVHVYMHVADIWAAFPFSQHISTQLYLRLEYSTHIAPCEDCIAVCGKESTMSHAVGNKLHPQCRGVLLALALALTLYIASQWILIRNQRQEIAMYAYLTH